MHIAKKRRAKMQFASEGEKADYERLVKSNPLNEGLYGMPRMALFPPSKVAPMSASVAGLPACQCEAPDAEFDEHGDMYLYCRSCGQPIRQTPQEVLDLIVKQGEFATV